MVRNKAEKPSVVKKVDTAFSRLYFFTGSSGIERIFFTRDSSLFCRSNSAVWGWIVVGSGLVCVFIFEGGAMNAALEVAAYIIDATNVDLRALEAHVDDHDRDRLPYWEADADDDMVFIKFIFNAIQIDLYQQLG